MTVKTLFGEYIIGGIYEHYKNNYYMLDCVAKLHDSQNIFIVCYHQCTREGIYISIRNKKIVSGQTEEVEEIIHQPFCTHETRWNDEVRALDSSGFVRRFKLVTN